VVDTNDQDAAISFGPFRLYARSRLLEKDGAPLHLGGRALDILIFLVERAGEVIDKRELIKRVWADVTGDGRAYVDCYRPGPPFAPLSGPDGPASPRYTPRRMATPCLRAAFSAMSISSRS